MRKDGRIHRLRRMSRTRSSSPRCAAERLRGLAFVRPANLSPFTPDLSMSLVEPGGDLAGVTWKTHAVPAAALENHRLGGAVLRGVHAIDAREPGDGPPQRARMSEQKKSGTGTVMPTKNSLPPRAAPAAPARSWWSAAPAAPGDAGDHLSRLEKISPFSTLTAAGAAIRRPPVVQRSCRRRTATAAVAGVGAAPVHGAHPRHNPARCATWLD